MDQKKPLNLLFLLMFISCLLSLDAAAAPLSRTLAMGNQVEAAAMKDGPANLKVTDKETEVQVEGGLSEGRMEIELNDYPGSGANNRHEPKNPGKP